MWYGRGVPSSPPSHEDDLRRLRNEKQRKDYNHAYDRVRRTAGTEGATLHRLRHTARWERVRAWVLNRDALCVHCQARGITRAASQVDHIELATNLVRDHGTNAFYDTTQLQGLCVACHARKSAAERRRA